MKKIIILAIVVGIILSFSGCGLFDNEAPSITFTDGQSIEVEVGTVFDVNNYVSFSDNKAEEPVLSVDNQPDTDKIGAYSVSISVTDEADNVSTEILEVAIVDTTAPVIELEGDIQMHIDFKSSYDEQAATVSDNYDVCDLIIEGEVNSDIMGSYTITYLAEDNSGNKTIVERTVLVSDLSGPVITIEGESAIHLPLGKAYEGILPIAVDEVDGEVTVEVSSHVNHLVAGTYTIVYIAEDQAGNRTELEREVVIDPLVATTDTGIVTTLYGIRTFLHDTLTAGAEVEYDIEVTNNSGRTITIPFMYLYDNGMDIMTYFERTSIYGEFETLEAGMTKRIQFEEDYTGSFNDIFDAKGITFNYNFGDGVTGFPYRFDFCITDCL
ncbi:MAG: DUF5011 domain-containing protein [Vallitaleaceae bacterium]|jgi:hypothetical protein|nr:DUF5011 domain-containing protein [Vallitaleaceae bacterium]